MTAIYHITSIRNLSNILKVGGLWCDSIVAQRGQAIISIAHQQIKKRRASREVPFSPGGVVADYVPFYFATRSPMLCAIYHNNVAGYNEGQRPILHLVSSVEAVIYAGLPFVFTDGHAPMELSTFFSNVNDLNQIDWNIMKAKYWNDTIEDGDRTRRRQAEFLVHEFFPFHLFDTIGVFNDNIANQVSVLLDPLVKKPIVMIKREWYY